MNRASIRPAVAKALAEITGVPAQRISDTSDIVDDLGVDSMISVSLLVAIEDHVGCRVPDGSEGSLVGVRKVGELVDRLAIVFANPDSDFACAGLPQGLSR
jgi:acyl carrier protein